MEKKDRLDRLPRTGMGIERGRIEGVWRLVTEPVDDERGFFTETYRGALIEEALGRPFRFAQGNHSRSVAGTLRGFRCEPWDKLVYVAHGTALIVVADPRPASPTFGQHEVFHLGDAPGGRDRILISKGLANAFYCVTEVDYINDVSAEYSPDGRRGFLWNDPELGVDWPTESPILSLADRSLPPFRDFVAGA
jgi:dTDP-4-dehydrorhamnose 3,5-epimerase